MRVEFIINSQPLIPHNKMGCREEKQNFDGDDEVFVEGEGIALEILG